MPKFPLDFKEKHFIYSQPWLQAFPHGVAADEKWMRERKNCGGGEKENMEISLIFGKVVSSFLIKE